MHGGTDGEPASSLHPSHANVNAPDNATALIALRHERSEL